MAASLCASIAACDGDASRPEPDTGRGPTPAAVRIAWSQQAPSLAIVQGYSFLLFIDDARTPLSAVSCAAVTGSPGFECSAALPALSPGARLLALATVDPASGLESARSTPPLRVDVGSDGRPLPRSGGSAPALRLSGQHDVPLTACTAAGTSSCFAVGVIATGVGPVRRLLPLPDGRLIALRQDGTLTIFPSGASERPPLARDDAGPGLAIVDVAADPEFETNRLLYFATLGGAPGRREVSIIRVRELAERTGEAAAIVTGLPISSIGEPVIAAGSDRHLYLAMPLDPTVERQFYDGHVLRFTPDGAAAGHARAGSPVLAQGSIRPMSFAWIDGAGLLVASGASGGSPLAMVASDARPDAWPAALLPVGGASAGVFSAGVRGVASDAGTGRMSTRRLAVLGMLPEALYMAALTEGDSPRLASVEALPLGSLTPTSAVFTRSGDLAVAARAGDDPVRTHLLLLRAR
jgi:hypothetical protein